MGRADGVMDAIFKMTGPSAEIQSGGCLATVRHWIDDRTGGRWLVAVSGLGATRVEGRRVRLIWFARNREFWSTELYVDGEVEAFPEDLLREHLARAQGGWYQGSGGTGRRS